MRALWDALWPNVIAPNAWTLAGIGLHLLVTLAHRRRLHEDMKRHVTRAIKEGR